MLQEPSVFGKRNHWIARRPIQRSYVRRRPESTAVFIGDADPRKQQPQWSARKSPFEAERVFSDINKKLNALVAKLLKEGLLGIRLVTQSEEVANGSGIGDLQARSPVRMDCVCVKQI